MQLIRPIRIREVPVLLIRTVLTADEAEADRDHWKARAETLQTFFYESRPIFCKKWNEIRRLLADE